MDIHVPAVFDIPRRADVFSVQEREPNWYRWGVVVLILASVTDLLTTFVGIEYHGLVEANGTPATILKQGGWMGLVQLSLASLGIIIGLTALLRYVQINYSSLLATLSIGVASASKVLATTWNTWLILTV